ncbi:MAG TPA: response regulator transcription factor, partial [Propionibacteriaceae bacterium]
MTRILLVEDDAAIRRALRRSLEDQGDAVAVAPDGMTGLRLVLSEQPDVVLLDLGLPDVDGLRMLGMLRGVSDVPVIVVTAQDDDRTVVKALDAGADDYVVKPFGTEQVQARIRAVMRRVSRPAGGDGPVIVAGLSIDPRSRAASLDGERLELSRKEFDLLFL